MGICLCCFTDSCSHRPSKAVSIVDRAGALVSCTQAAEQRRGAWPWAVSMEKTNPDLLMTLLLLKDGREVADGVSGERDPDRDKGQRNVRHQQENVPERKST